MKRVHSEQRTRVELEQSLRYALAKQDPAALVKPHLPNSPPRLILAVGKAALPMLGAAREAFPVSEWLAVHPEGQDAARTGVTVGRNGVVIPGSHPLPDERSLEAGKAVLQRVKALEEHDSLLLLVSGGGSSLLSWPIPGVTLEEKREVVSELMLAGADIFELNAVRKHLSRLKGGRLAAATAAKVLNLVISDVPGDDVSTVASGLATPDGSTFADALRVLDRFGVKAPAVRRHFQLGLDGKVPENPGPRHRLWGRVETRLIGSNKLLLMAARDYWRGRGYQAIILSDRVQGEARDVAREHAQIVETIRTGLRAGSIRSVPHVSEEVRSELRALKPSGGRVVVLSGGETTVSVRGVGVGGRNQEFALWLLKYLKQEGVWALSAGSDGIDGNSGSAGAWLTPDSWQRAAVRGLSVTQHLQYSDSGSFFEELGDNLVTGYTGNNLNDYRAIVVDV